MATHLLPALQRAGEKVEVVLSRDSERASALAGRFLVPHATTQAEILMRHSDIIWFLTKDSVMQQWVDQVVPHLKSQQILMHAAGAVPLEHLSVAHPRCAVIYPLYTFTTEAEVDFRKIPLFVEATPEVLGIARRLAAAITPHWFIADSDTRLRLHIGAVWACNFTNYCLTIANDLIRTSPFSFRDAYGPILNEIIRKALEQGPDHSQTGPAVRRDNETLLRHLDYLQSTGDHADMYRSLTEKIQERFPQ